MKPGAPAVWDECPDNISNIVERGKKADTEEAIKDAAKVIKRRYVITRVHAQYMEPRGTLGVYDPGEDRLTLYADVQYPHRVRNMLAQNVFKVPESKMRVIAQRCRRRLRHQGLAVHRASPDLVGGAQAAAAGEVDLRALARR